jgi:hypothetical protein
MATVPTTVSALSSRGIALTSPRPKPATHSDSPTSSIFTMSPTTP